MMKRFLGLFYLMFLIMILPASAQVEVSYMIPDIGAPDMNTYIEIIAPYNATAPFGPDSIYMNNPGDNLRVRCANATDESKIIIGPCVVSWGGRLISTQIFVHPDIIPSSSDWESLDPKDIIQLVVDYNGSTSALGELTFYIVQPYNLGTNGDISGLSYRSFGNDALGKRSPRGAMIVDSLFLAGQTYKLLTNPGDWESAINDCDPNTDGNQGYLPFILLSKGPIRGISGSKISVSAESTHGGPGGGGGGGKYCDWSISPSSGANGGKGFTGGGPGGYNGSGLGTDTRRDPGEGTGGPVDEYTGDMSLNGVPGGYSTIAYESAGGGTGHPFGLSGEGCISGSACNPNGGYGGGSGYRQDETGGGGGYGTEGDNSGGASTTGGKVHGNIQVIPIAGGSGGASGNPQGVGECSGQGAGGGGAIRIFASELSNIEINANGSGGGSASSGAPRGGGSSGGHVSMLSKLGLNNMTMTALGGSFGGGEGRLRYDAPVVNNMTTLPSSPASLYRGISSDTTKYVNKRDTLRGSFLAGRTVTVYMKPETGSWQKLSGVTYSGSDWEIIIDFPTTDTLFFVAAVQDVVNPSTNQYSYEPPYVMSQAAANILNILPQPIIAREDTISVINVIMCDDAENVDTAWVANIGKADLELVYDNNSFADGTKGFELIPPIRTNVVPGDSIPVVIKFTRQPGQFGTIYDTLLIEHNDLESERIPWKIFCEAHIDTLGLTFVPDTLDFGKICIGSDTTMSFEILNEAKNSTLNLTDPEIVTDNGLLTVVPQETELVNGAGTMVDVNFTAEEGVKTYLVYLRLEECPEIYDSIFVTGEGVYAELEFTDTDGKDTVDLGMACLGQTLSKIIGIENISINSIQLNEPYVLDETNFSISLLDPIDLPINQKARVQINFIPPTTGDFVTKLYIGTDDCGSFIDSIYVKGSSVDTKLTFDPKPLDFGEVNVGSSETLELRLTNSGAGKATINTLPTLPAPFSIDSYTPTPLPVTLESGEVLTFQIKYTPSSEGAHSQEMVVSSIEFDGSCEASDTVELLGEGVKADVSLSSPNILFGLIKNCHDSVGTVTISNAGSASATINENRIEGNDEDNFELITKPNTPYELSANGGSFTYQVRFFADKDMPDGPKTAMLKITMADGSNFFVELSGENEGLDISINSGLPFDGGPIGPDQTKTITLANNGSFDAHVVEIVSSEPKITVTPNTATIAPGGGTQNFTATLDMSEAGSFETDLLFVFDSYCDDTLVVEAKGVVFDGNVTFTTAIDYDTLRPCESDTMDFKIENTGETQVELQTMTIEGTDAALFSIETPFAPTTIAVGGSYENRVIFTPGASMDGPKTAKIVSSVFYNNDNHTLETALTGVRSSGLITAPEIVDFGTRYINNTYEQFVTITNTGNLTVNITGSEPLNNPGIFAVVPNPVVGTLAPGETIQIKIEFSPLAAQTYSDMLRLKYTDDVCPDEYKIIEISGTGVDRGTIYVELPVLSDINPSLRSYKIPVYAWLGEDSGVNETLIGFSEIPISFNANLFFPTGASKGVMTYTKPDDRTRNVLITINQNFTLTMQKQVITELVGDVLLGDVTSSQLEFGNVAFLDTSGAESGAVTPTNGSLSIRICEQGGKRLLTPKYPLSIGIFPNPATDKFNVKAVVLEAGAHRLELIGMRGETYALKSWIVSKDGPFEFEFVFSAKDFSNGIYYLRLQSPTENIVQPVFIVK